MNFLRNKRAYLSGAIEFGGVHNWREAPIKKLTEEFGISVFDPFSDPKEQWAPEIINARKDKDFDKLANIAKSFVRKDLCMVDRSDFLIAYMPYKVATTGTTHEIIVSSNAKKPTLIVCPEGREFAPAWLWGILPKNSFFDSWEHLYSYLQEVTDGKHADNHRWHFCYGLI